MFSISLEQNQYKTYILGDRQTKISVVPERGGIITRWQVQGQDIFYLDEERFTHPELSVRGGNPILFPICGNLPDNIYTYQGQEYTLKQHGFARDLPWEVEEVQADNLTYLTLHLHSSEQTKAVYPFEFHLAFSYILSDDSLEIRQTFTNHSSQPMPFSVGFHPYLIVGDKNQLELTIPSAEYQDQKTKEYQPFSGNFDWERDEIDVAFKKLEGKSATVTDHSRRLKLTLEADDIFSTFVFWTLKGKDFYCIEPWSAPRNAINTGEKLSILESGGSLTASCKLIANFF
ncbi:aldose epimerase family protein [Calothrix sp. 336/3]|uniref:aldose epimerase family protein n=1 Tax=Calothrix sp. 336/3 TaxID=1337936 RepID=UPI0004E3522A|nr:aldose epimerase [Calothrix sp. 336/3]AKG21766.1 aldose epimerase [Calothrix sp. 336/3]